MSPPYEIQPEVLFDTLRMRDDGRRVELGVTVDGMVATITVPSDERFDDQVQRGARGILRLKQGLEEYKSRASNREFDILLGDHPANTFMGKHGCPTYDPATRMIHLGAGWFNGSNLSYLIKTIVHETNHHAIHQVAGRDASGAYDKISYYMEGHFVNYAA